MPQDVDGMNATASPKLCQQFIYLSRHNTMSNTYPLIGLSRSALCIGLVCWLTLSLQPDLRADAPSPTALTFYERFVAIDGACGWPNLSLLPDGRIAAVIWPLNNHGVTEGAAECWLSDDHGATWRRASVPVPHQLGTNRMNVAAGEVDGKLLALVGGWDKRRPYTGGKSMSSEGAAERARLGAVTINPVVAWSGDSGEHWEQFPEMEFPKRPANRSLVPYGRVAKLADGHYGVCLYGDGVFFFTSLDGGASWTKRGTIVSHPGTHNETTWVQLDNGDLYAAARTFGLQRLEGYRSRDGGRNWTPEGPLTMALQIPGDLLKLPDGRVLLSYGARNRGLYGVWVQVGDPELTTWSAPMLLVDFQGSSEFQHNPVPSSDGGYPSTVQLADGTFVTAYYSRGVPAHQRYHVGVVRWTLRPNGLPSLKPVAP